MATNSLTTTKDKDFHTCFQYQYYLKPANKDGSIREVCKEK
jgi:hypothetical protein